MVDAALPSLDAIRAVVAEQLEVPVADIGAEDDLVELGVHSMCMIKLAAQWRRSGFDVNFGELAANPSVRDWFELLRGRAQADDTREPEPAAARDTENADDTFGLATMQHAYWVGRSDEQALGGVAAHLYAEFDGGEVDPERLERAVAALLRRHPMLRCQFLDNGRQRVLEEPGVPAFEHTDLRDLPEEQAQRRLTGIREAKTHQRMPAELGKVFDVALSSLPGGRTRLHVDVDMLAADALSYRVLMADLAAFYHEGPQALDPLEYTYRDYLEDRANPEAREREREWWLGQLPQLPDPPVLPLVPEAERADPRRTVRYAQHVGAEGKHRLIERSKQYGVTPAAVLAAVFAEVIGRWSGNQRFLLNLPLFNREPTHADIEQLVGDFSNSVMLDMDCTGEASPLERARELQRRLHGSAAHADYPGLDVLRDLGRYRGQPLLAPVVYTSGLNLGELFRESVPRTFGDPVWIVSQGPQVVLDAQVVELDGGLLLNWDVREHAFPDGLMAEMFGRHRTIIENLLAEDADWTVPFPAGLPAAQQDVRDRDNAVTAPRSGSCLHDGFFAIAARDPERTALYLADSSTVSFGELRERALRIAGALAENGVRQGDAVSIQLPKGPDQVSAVLGVLAAGAAYVPIGADQPPARRDRIQRIGEVVLGLVPDGETEDQRVPALAFGAAAGHTQPFAGPVELGSGAIAYVLFTSGSTGEPKGVEVAHAAAMNTIEGCAERFGVTTEDRGIALSPLEFDLSVQEIFGTLSVGASLVVAEESARRDGTLAAALLREHAVTQLYCVPALLDMILAAGASPSLRTVLLGGDWVGAELPARLREIAPGCRFAGLGGATETAIHHTVCEVGERPPADWKAVPFGVPLPNTRARVVNERGLDCPDWVAGELWIGGSGLASGYRGDPERTADRFVTYAGSRWYRTGDRARYRPDGTIEFLGRADEQVKIRGYRIELGEVEQALRSVDGVRQAVAEVLGSRAPVLAAAVTGSADPERLRVELAATLPGYMVPERIEVLDAIPLTGSGKVARRQVRVLLGAEGTEQRYTPPDNDLESALAMIVGEVLEVRRVGVETDFFALGGDSVLGTVAIARIREWLDTADVSVADLYTGRHVRGLAELLAGRQRTPGRLEQVAKLYLEVAEMPDEDVLTESAAG
ncbi:non-ribosomal peptide synthetase [Sciscionella marina]|uniref:non-ribosomal peptide synthetase n=1 Tax=Sciscionella marina TaxID=508770 RepID=UPI00036F5F4E|nr:non-ribosomal peptide synthetase [Sciscionella marina]